MRLYLKHGLVRFVQIVLRRVYSALMSDSNVIGELEKLCFLFQNTSQLRTTVMVVLCLFVGLPLALLKNIESLSNVSAISIGFYMVFVAEVTSSVFLCPNTEQTILFTKRIRRSNQTYFCSQVFASAFPNLWSGIWVAKVEVWNPEGVFKCLPIFSLAFGCQT